MNVQSNHRRCLAWLRVLLVLIGTCLLLGQGGRPPQEWEAKLDRLTANWTFDFLTWELRALSRKMLYALLSPQRFMGDRQQSRFVLAYLDDVGKAKRLSREIDRIYADPDVEDPGAASQDDRQALASLRYKIRQRGPIAEAILQSQISMIFTEEGDLGLLHTILPPVSGTFTPLPYILIVSPRAVIRSVYQQQLVAGLTAKEQVTIEESVMDALPDYSAYVTAIGGLAAYPAMLLETSSIDWVTNVMAHEWVHHYLAFHPLGWYYMQRAEARTINETTACLIGDWAGQEAILRYYWPLLARKKELPQPLRVEEEAEGGEAPTFDFRAEMHHTRVIVDRLLAQGRIKEAEWYMEAQRRYFVAHGYQIRRLNQAYFAFHGAYASEPGAAGEDPIGPLVRELWALSDTPGSFLRHIAPVASLSELRARVPGDRG